MDNNMNLEVAKQFECSKEDLFKAWTEQEQLQQWWKPLGKNLESVTNDLKEGGSVKYQFEGDDLTIDGQYEKVSPNNELQYTWNWHVASEPIEDASYKLGVRFTEEAGKATISVTQTGFKNQESIQPHKQGWEQGLQQLADYLNRNNNQRTAEPSEQKPPITGYMETPEQQKVGGG